MKKELGIFLLLILLCIIVSVVKPLFISPTNIQNVSALVGMYGIFSIGVGIVIITGGIDLSVGSLFALLGVLLSIMLNERQWPELLASGAVIAIGLAIGLMHGLFVTRLGVQPFIVTLCGLLFYRGLARVIAQDATKGFGESPEVRFKMLDFLANGQVGGIRMPFILLILVSIVAWIVLHRSVYGRYLFAVGGNEQAARYAGVDSRRVTTLAYVSCSGLAALASILNAFYVGSISPSSHGNLYELYGIAAAVLGGCSLRGGEGSVIGILLGTILFQVLQNLMIFMKIPSTYEYAVMGAIVLIVVVADQLFGYRSARKA
ncbi:MAG: ABC transporter permease [Armatimonadota bacterium]|nr:ABC transporter permease [Armatimonadota bacterium]